MVSSESHNTRLSGMKQDVADFKNETLKRVRDMVRPYSQMHCTDKYSQHSSIIWPVWLNG